MSRASGDVREFNEFIDEMELVDVLMHNRSYTWFKSGGQAKSRINRVLLSMEWLQHWPSWGQ